MQDADGDRAFDSIADLFSILSTPIRLKIISSVCQIEKSVSDLLVEINATQPNMSQHLRTLYRSGILARRREGAQVYYRIHSDQVAALCRCVCNQVATHLVGDAAPATKDAGEDAGIRS